MSTLPRFAANPGPSPTAILVVHQLWGHLLLESRTLAQGRGLTAGAARDLQLKVLDTPVARLPGWLGPMAVPGFFEVVDHSAGDLDAPGDVEAVVEAEGTRWRVVSLPDDVVEGDQQGLVPVGGVVEVHRGPITYRLHHTDRPAPIARPGVAPEPTLWSAMSTIGAAALALVVIAATAPAPPQIELLDIEDRVARLVLTPPAPALGPEPVAEVSAESGGEGGMAAGPQRPEAGTGGSSVEEAGLLAALNGGLLGAADLDLSLTAAAGALQAGSSNGLPGGGGMGRRGGQLGGGGTAEDGVGLVTRPGLAGLGDGTLPGKKVTGPQIQPARDVLLIGALPASAIDEVVRKHLAQFRYCYQRRLAQRPEMSGKVAISFTIASDGSVSAANVARSALSDPEVESCMVGRFLRLKFPSPKGGGIVRVTYPFIFSPG